MLLDDFLSRLGAVDTEADGYLATCPAHPDSRASLRVSVSDNGKVLVKCRAGCSTPEVMAAVGLSMRDLAGMEPGESAPAVRATSTSTPASPAQVAALKVNLDAWAEQLTLEDAGDVCTYAADRFGIAGADAERLGLGFADNLGGGRRLVVPFRDAAGVARGFQARALQPDATVRWLGPASPEGASWSKVGYFPSTSGWSEVVITEGPSDALTACAAGYDVIAVAGAANASNASVVMQVSELLGNREAIIAGDGDPAGRRFSSTLAESLANAGHRVRVLHMADGLDLTDWRAQGPERFQANLIRAVSESEPVTSKDAAMLSWDESRYSFTDLGGARFLRDWIESRDSGVKYTEEAGFFLLEEGVWRKDERQAVRTHAQEVADHVRGIAANVAASAVTDDDKKLAARLNRFAGHIQSSRGIDSMLRELQAVNGVPVSLTAFDRHEHLIAARNGVVNLRTGALQGHDPELLLTRRIEHDYEPDAVAPRWEQFLHEVFPSHAELPDYMQRLIGYGLTGSTAEQCFAVLWGTGANGKSVFTDTLTEVFREATVTTPFSTFEAKHSGGIPNDLAALKGARLVMAAEGEQGKPMAEAVLKRVTGRDMIAARFMRKEFFEFRPSFLLMLATNFKPSFRGQDEGLWRRVKLIPWDRYFKPEERDHRLGDTLLDESAGIFAWAVRGSVRWYAGGLQDPAIIVDSTKEYRAASDVLEGFLPGVYVADPDGKVLAQTVFHDFQTYADDGNYLDLKKWSNRGLYKALEERGFARRRGTGGQFVIEGVRRANAHDHAVPVAPERTISSPLATSSPVTTPTAPRAGASLDDLAL